jgi:hypothetical protein
MFLAATGSVATGEAQSLDDIIARHTEAIGGIDKIRAIRSVRMSGRVTAGGGRQALVMREIEKPGRVRTEFTYQGVTGVYAFDGERGWKVSPFDGSLDPEPMTDEESLQTSDQADIEGPLVDWKAKGHQVALSGKETLDGRDVYKLEVTLRSGRVSYQFVDARSFLTVRTESTRIVRGFPLHIETTFADFRDAAGVLFPRAIETGVVGRPRRLTVSVDEVEVNPTLPDGRFAMPALQR